MTLSKSEAHYLARIMRENDFDARVRCNEVDLYKNGEKYQTVSDYAEYAEIKYAFRRERRRWVVSA